MTVTVPVGERERRRPDLAGRRRPRAAAPARRRPPRERRRRPLDHLAPVRRRPRRAPGQYALLGIGGVRALHALGVEPGVVHLNEGHAAFAGLELARAAPRRRPPRTRSRPRARRTVFTTHTPVPAGNDTYPAAQVAATLGGIAARDGRRRRRARPPRPHPSRRRATSRSASRSSRCARARIANGVSARHGEVAREMWHDLWPDRAGRGRADRARHQRRAHPDLDRRADARPARPPPRRGLDRPGGRSRDVGRRRRDPRRRAVGRAQRAAPRAGRARARAQRHRAPRPRRHARVRARRGRRRSIPTC